MKNFTGPARIATVFVVMGMMSACGAAPAAPAVTPASGVTAALAVPSTPTPVSLPATATSVPATLTATSVLPSATPVPATPTATSVPATRTPVPTTPTAEPLKLPADAPLPATAVIVGSVHTANDGQLILASADSPDSIAVLVEFYKQALPRQGWHIRLMGQNTLGYDIYADKLSEDRTLHVNLNEQYPGVTGTRMTIGVDIPK